MFHKTRCSIAVLVLAGLMIPAAQAFADPLLPEPHNRLICNYWFKNGGPNGTFESEFIAPWTPRGVPPPNKLWSGRNRNFFFNPSNPSQPITIEQDWDLAYKPHELGQALEVTIRKEGKQCKDFRVVIFRNHMSGTCREIQTVRNCVGGGLENLDRQVCRSKYPWPCSSHDERRPEEP